ncbi:MAG: hypothetical protein KBA33_00390 [Cloacibacterium sp.]|jgi:hypothetical protein|nr:hypothetical protein [Cloacibacterium sp.]
MQNRILKGWNIRRAFYLIGGLLMAGQSIAVGQWIFGVFALYFIIMAVFNLGCAAGNCSVNYTSDKKENAKP